MMNFLLTVKIVLCLFFCIFLKETPCHARADKIDPLTRCLCQNGGTCVESGRCICPSGTTGSFCEAERERRIRTTRQITCRCENGGRCDATGNCICPSGFTGSRCENRPTVNCPDPGSIQFGYRRTRNRTPSQSSRTYSSRQYFKYYCNQGYELIGNNVLICLPSGKWSSNLPRCQSTQIEPAVYCSSPGLISFGSYRNNVGNSAANERFTVGQSVNYYCQSGYDLIGGSVVKCLPSGLWSNKPLCRRVITPLMPRDSTASCPDPGSIQYGYRRFINGTPSRFSQIFRNGQSLRFYCNQGYMLQGSSVMTCLPSGEWSSNTPWCQSTQIAPATYCNYPGVDLNGIIDDNNSVTIVGERRVYLPGDELNYRCVDGYEVKGPSDLVCTLEGEWSGNPPKCRLRTTTVMCRDPGFLPNGGLMVHYRSRRLKDSDVNNIREYPAGTRLSYDCKSGFRLEGQKKLVCGPTGSWEGKMPVCTEDCGYSTLQAGGKITNGKNTKAGEFPWIVFLFMNQTRISCGGVLLDHRTVLTAAHCLQGSSYCTLYFGKYNRSNEYDDTEVKTRESSEIITHSGFNPVTYDNDIAIIKFSPDILYSGRIQPICMPSTDSTHINVVTGEMGYVAGWGLNEKQRTSSRLMLADLPVQTSETCETAYRRRSVQIKITEGMFCAGYSNDTINACTGDSGSPMVFYNIQTQRFVLEGLVSHGTGGKCDRPERYTMFTRVSHYLPWINENWRPANN